jgi:hypothetical protein
MVKNDTDSRPLVALMMGVMNSTRKPGTLSREG